METTINVLIPDAMVGSDYIKEVINNNQNLPIKIATNMRLIDLLPKNKRKPCIKQMANEFLDWKYPTMPRFETEDKFNFIILNAHMVHDYGINSFQLEYLIENFAKDDCEVIIRICNACSKCNEKIKGKYPNVDITWKHRLIGRKSNSMVLKKIFEVALGGNNSKTPNR